MDHVKTGNTAAGIASRILSEATRCRDALRSQYEKRKLAKSAQDGVKRLNLVEWRMSMVIEKFEDWIETWQLDSDPEEDSLRYMWGGVGYKHVLDALRKILRLLEDKGDLLVSLAIAITSRKKPPKLFRRNSNLQKQFQSQEDESFDLMTFVKGLSHEIDALFITSKSAFRTSHPMTLPNTDPSYKDPIISKACESIPAMKLIFLSCVSSGVDFRLNIERINSIDLEDRFKQRHTAFEPICYHLSADTGDETESAKAEEAIAEYLDDHRSRFSSREAGDRNNTFLTVESIAGSTCIPFRQSKERTFYVCFDSKYDESSISSPSLRNLIYQDAMDKGNATTEAHANRTTSMRERLSLACRLAQATLFLLGTPWLAYLRGDNVFDSTIAGGLQGFVLKLRAMSPMTECKELPTEIVSSAQLFTLGILLIEIALGRPTNIASEDINLDWETHAEELAHVNDAMGFQYCEAASFCLRTQTSLSVLKPLEDDYDEEIQQQSQQILAGFHSEVLCRLKRMEDDFYR